MPSNRPTRELLVLILGIGVAVEMVVAMIAVVLISLIRPEVDIGQAMSGLGNQIAIVAVAVIGYLAGNTKVRIDQKKKATEPKAEEDTWPPT